MANAPVIDVPEEKEEGAPAWMVTFGDMMSLLLAFFVMLFSISEIKKEKFSAAVNSFREYFDFKGGAATSELMEQAKVQTFKEAYLEFLKGLGEDRGGINTDTQSGKKKEARMIREGLTMTVGGIKDFPIGSTELPLDANGRSPELDEIAGKLRGYSFKIDVRGHADPTERNQLQDPKIGDLDHLSFERAQMVKNYLVKKGGIRPARISVTAESYHDPVGSDPDDAARNRIVEIVASETKVPISGEQQHG